MLPVYILGGVYYGCSHYHYRFPHFAWKRQTTLSFAFVFLAFLRPSALRDRCAPNSALGTQT